MRPSFRPDSPEKSPSERVAERNSHPPEGQASRPRIGFLGGTQARGVQAGCSEQVSPPRTVTTRGQEATLTPRRGRHRSAHPAPPRLRVTLGPQATQGVQPASFRPNLSANPEQASWATSPVPPGSGRDGRSPRCPQPRCPRVPRALSLQACSAPQPSSAPADSASPSAPAASAHLHEGRRCMQSPADRAPGQRPYLGQPRPGHQRTAVAGAEPSQERGAGRGRTRTAIGPAVGRGFAGAREWLAAGAVTGPWWAGLRAPDGRYRVESKLFSSLCVWSHCRGKSRVQPETSRAALRGVTGGLGIPFPRFPREATRTSSQVLRGRRCSDRSLLHPQDQARSAQ